MISSLQYATFWKLPTHIQSDSYALPAREKAFILPEFKTALMMFSGLRLSNNKELSVDTGVLWIPYFSPSWIKNSLISVWFFTADSDFTQRITWKAEAKLHHEE